MAGPRWRGLTLVEEQRLVTRWQKRRRLLRYFVEEDYIALVRAAEHAVISRVMSGKLRIVTPED